MISDSVLEAYYADGSDLLLRVEGDSFAFFIGPEPSGQISVEIHGDHDQTVSPCLSVDQARRLADSLYRAIGDVARLEAIALQHLTPVNA